MHFRQGNYPQISGQRSETLGWIRNWRRRKIRRKPFPVGWIGILQEYTSFVDEIPIDKIRKFQADLIVFEQEKEFIGAGGFEVTEEVRVVISAAAVRLVVNLDISAFDRVSEIIVYPGAYQHPDNNTVILGQVSDWHAVVLAWDAVVSGLRNARDGHDTATHEFAHVLDRGSGAFDGTPILRAHEDYGPWARVLSEHFLRLRNRGRRHRRLLREYAATNEAEFFAVATEVFFEKPRVMRRRAPDLYSELRRLYGANPAEVRESMLLEDDDGADAS